MTAFRPRTTVTSLAFASAALALSACQPQPASPPADAAAGTATAPAPAMHAPAQTDLIARGEYLVRVAGCNDCHTPGYAENQGKVPREQWLVGSPLGFHGPWGTTYATNLRLRLQDFSEDQWLAYSGTLRTRPIMPDFALRDMTEEDRRALYRFIRQLGPAGQPAPAALPPGQVPPTPHMTLVLPPAPPVTAPGVDGKPAAAPNAP